MKYNFYHLILLLLASCNSLSSENSDKEPDNMTVSKLNFKIIVEFKTDINGIQKKVKNLKSERIGSRIEAMSRINTYTNDFEDGRYVSFSSTKGVIKIHCSGLSDMNLWKDFYGGKLKLNDGKKIVVIGDLGAAGKVINNEKYISQKFLESAECFRKYGFQLISYEVVKIE